MKMKEKYKIEFQKTVGSNGIVFCYADNATIDNAELAHHLVCSSKMATEQQIKDLEIALQGGIIQEDWGETRGSSLYIYTSEGNVQVGYSASKIPITDFKQLLEEWLAFIS